MAPQQQQASCEEALRAALAAYIWLEKIIPARSWPDRSAIRVTGHVKPTEEVATLGRVAWQDQEAVNGAARKVREAFLGQAEDAIAAALRAGFALAEHPEITIGGVLRRDRETGLDVCVAEVTVSLWFRVP